MRVDNVLILAAGKGTRMGQIGKLVPKVIWPIFNKSILELEVEYAKKFSPKNIYINLFNSKEKILKFSQGKKIFEQVTFVEEDEILDIGGAVHNVAKKLNYQGNLLIINSDQFIILSKEKLNEFEAKSKMSDATLLVYSVDPQGGYGGLKLEDNHVTGLINKNDARKCSELVTYTGMSCIKLESLSKREGKSSFFDSVIDFKDVVPNFVNVDSCEYWDFGTLKRYKKSIEKINNSKDEFKSFLECSGVKILDTNQINDHISFSKDKIIFKS